MARSTKVVPRFVPAGQTYQVWTEADAGEWDFIMVKDSLGRPASHITIEATAAITVKFNVLHTVYPQRQLGQGFHELGLDNVSSGLEYTASGEMPDYVIDAASTLELTNEIAVSDIWIVNGGTDYIISVS